MREKFKLCRLDTRRMTKPPPMTTQNFAKELKQKKDRTFSVDLMKCDRYALVIAALHMACVQLRILVVIATAPETSGLGHQLEVVDERFCPSDDVHTTTTATNRGNARIDLKEELSYRIRKPRRRQKINEALHRQHVQQPPTETQAATPIEIVRQSVTSVKLKVHNTPWFASAALSVDFEKESRNRLYIDTPLQSEHRHEPDSFLPDRIKTRCSGRESFATVRVYVRCKRPDNNNNKHSDFETIAMCDKYLFKLKNSVGCDNPTEYVENATSGSDTPSSSPPRDHSKIPSAGPAAPEPNPSISPASKPIRKQNRVRESAAAAPRVDAVAVKIGRAHV